MSGRGDDLLPVSTTGRARMFPAPPRPKDMTYVWRGDLENVRVNGNACLMRTRNKFSVLCFDVRDMCTSGGSRGCVDIPIATAT